MELVDLTNYEELIEKLDKIWTSEQWENFIKSSPINSKGQPDSS